MSPFGQSVLRTVAPSVGLLAGIALGVAAAELLDRRPVGRKWPLVGQARPVKTIPPQAINPVEETSVLPNLKMWQWGVLLLVVVAWGKYRANATNAKAIAKWPVIGTWL